MSIDWFRSWHGAPTDSKWLLIAKRAGVTPGIVSAVVWALFDHASQAEQRGNVETFDVETYAVFSGFSEENITAIIFAMKEKSLIVSGTLSAWEKRQPKRNDDSAERVREHRNAVKRTVTQCNSREEKRREEKIEKEVSKKDTREVALFADPPDFDEFWGTWPNKVGRSAAVKAYGAAIKRGTKPSDIVDGVRSYIRDKPPDRQWLNPATFLNQSRWEDKPAQVQNGKTSNVLQAADNLVSILDSFDRGAAETDAIRGPTGPSNVRLISQG